MNIQFMSMENQCELLPRITFVFPWGPIHCGFVYFGFLWWLLVIRFGDMPYEEDDI